VIRSFSFVFSCFLFVDCIAFFSKKQKILFLSKQMVRKCLGKAVLSQLSSISEMRAIWAVSHQRHSVPQNIPLHKKDMPATLQSMSQCAIEKRSCVRANSILSGNLLLQRSQSSDSVLPYELSLNTPAILKVNDSSINLLHSQHVSNHVKPLPRLLVGQGGSSLQVFWKENNGTHHHEGTTQLPLLGSHWNSPAATAKREVLFVSLSCPRPLHPVVFYLSPVRFLLLHSSSW
jgi:hypothetical protein